MAFSLNIFAALTRVQELEKERTFLLEKQGQLEKDLAEAQDVIGNFMVKQKDFDTQIETLKKEYQTKIESLEVKLLEAQKSAGKQAATLLASIGVEPEAVKVSVTPTEGDILTQFEKLTGADKQAFYAKNREAILKASGLIK